MGLIVLDNMQVGVMSMSDELRRNMALFTIGSVMKLSDLTARQIRYYEQHGLINPARTNGNQRLFSFNDVQRLLEIKSLIEKGVNIAGIKQVLLPVAKDEEEGTVLNDQTENKRKKYTEQELHKMVKADLTSGNRPGKVSMIQGQLTQFFR
jgi:MerR family transcriptional regulator, glutamine synthetase repressor